MLQADRLQPILTAAEARWSAIGLAPALTERLK
jgi:hypothetical protein